MQGGASFFLSYKGTFKVKNEGLCKLFIYKNKPPYIRIEFKNDKILYLNCKDPLQTIDLYNKIKIKALGN
jgi:hypothetical protein